jgi:hypothetical protein
MDGWMVDDGASSADQNTLSSQSRRMTKGRIVDSPTRDSFIYLPGHTVIPRAPLPPVPGSAHSHSHSHAHSRPEYIDVLHQSSILTCQPRVDQSRALTKGSFRAPRSSSTSNPLGCQ